MWKVIYVLQSVGFNNGDCNFRDFGGARLRSLWNKNAKHKNPSGKKSPNPTVVSYPQQATTTMTGSRPTATADRVHFMVCEIIAEKQNAKQGHCRRFSTAFTNPRKCFAYRVTETDRRNYKRVPKNFHCIRLTCVSSK